jgi:hypothetical protein
MRSLGCRLRTPHAKRSTKGSRKFARKNLVFSKTLAALPAARSPGLPTNTVMCHERMTPLSSRVCHERLPRGVVELGVDVGDHQVDLAHPSLRDEAFQLGQRGLRCLRRHGQADEPIRRRLAEVQQPVVVDAVAGGADRNS